MGRGKLLLKRIEDKNSRHVTFSKRRGGLMKKAKELSVLCDVDVAVFVFSGKGKLYEFSTADSLRKILQRCHIPRESDISCGSAQTTERQINEEGGTNLLQAVQRYLEELKVEQLSMTEIPQLEHRLDAVLHQLRMKKEHLVVEAVTDLHEKEKQLREGNQSTQKQIPGPTMENENTTMACDNFHYQPKQSQEENNPLLVEDMEELYNNGMPLNPQYYML